MTFSKSNLNLLPESLFTELTADQAQMLEGGKRIDILLVRCIKASNGFDNLSFTINGQKVGSTIGLQTGGVANVGASANFNGSASVNLFDRGSSLGGFSASSNTNGSQTRRVSSNGSIYDVTFKVGN
jgi:hypothetical protein